MALLISLVALFHQIILSVFKLNVLLARSVCFIFIFTSETVALDNHILFPTFHCLYFTLIFHLNKFSAFLISMVLYSRFTMYLAVEFST